jgi:hypothetical protein
MVGKIRTIPVTFLLGGQQWSSELKMKQPINRSLYTRSTHPRDVTVLRGSNTDSTLRTPTEQLEQECSRNAFCNQTRDARDA